ncbi:RNA polymerase sigma factor [Arenibacter troitsensis]|jgi:RNA polymerase sigma-70 factor (ECF subfamily)|uniref:RNA polymerase sigma-70 factor, ECF subfamily n=1 Tax=Arenibacter troitsensis TaxID=188872 RepID=A0A1X7KL20_9FLAO|nr:RNA polymerase sigma-70 factor [Arenibacter troitsensis]MDX1768813.1 RNA polymerase sigma-70 factor [Arenibacter troitsensis]SMG41404.1 RNA polymerase sigma-70 factor, ECF subfamily [Arenibacter troitsensis]
MTNADRNTLVLVGQLIAGEEKAFEQVMETYYKKLLIYAYSFTNDYPQAQDIVQNVFLRLWERRQNINIRESFQGLLYKSVYNEYIDDYRRKKSSIIINEAYKLALNYAVEDTNYQLVEDKIALIKKEVEHLPPRCKQIFLLSKQDGLTNSEIATYLDISIKTVEYQIAQAYSVIRTKTEVKIKKLAMILFSYIKLK